METQNLMLYKLMILYMLDRIDEYSLTNSQITKFIVDKGYTNHFNVLESISELIDKNFISVSTIRNTKRYKITSQGEEALGYFENKISNNIKQEIMDYIKKEKINLKNESEIFADFIYNEHNEYTVKCTIMERREIILEVRMNVPTKEMARNICDKWRSKSTDVYQLLIKEFMDK